MVKKAKEKSDIDTLRDQARKLVRGYNGSSSADDELLHVVKKYEDQFNVAGKPKSYTAPDTFLNNALQSLSRSWKNSTSLNDLFTQLEQAGTHVVRHEDVFIKPVMQRAETNGKQQPWKDFEFPSRLAMVMSALQEQDIHTDQIEIHVSQINPNSMRKRPYVIVNVYDDADKDNGGLQITVCDQKGEISFTSDMIYKADYFKDMDKTMLASLPGVAPVRHVNDEGFIERLLAPLDKRERALSPAFVNADSVKKKSAKKQKITLSHDLIRKVARDTIKKTGMTMKVNASVYLPDGTTGDNISSAFYDKGRGLNDTKYNSLPKFLHAEGLSFQLSEEIVEDLLSDWIRKHNGDVPDLNTEGDVYLKNGMKTNWKDISTNIAKGTSGFPKGIYKGLGEFKDQKGLNKGGDKYNAIMVDMGLAPVIVHEKITLSHDIIRKVARDTIKETGKAMKTGRTVYLLDGSTGDDITNAFRNKWRGLDDTPYKNLSEFLRAEDLDFHLNEEIVQDLIKDWIREHNGEIPRDRTKGDVFLENGIKTNWSTIDQAIRYGRNGFPKDLYKGLGEFKDQKGLNKGGGVYNTIIAEMERDIGDDISGDEYCPA